MARSPFSINDVFEIRRLAALDQLDVRAWANARDVSLETVRRIARGDTYRHIKHGPPPAQQDADTPMPRPKPAGPALAAEPDDEEVAASLERLAQATKAIPQPREVDQMLDDLIQKGRDGR